MDLKEKIKKAIIAAETTKKIRKEEAVAKALERQQQKLEADKKQIAEILSEIEVRVYNAHLNNDKCVIYIIPTSETATPVTAVNRANLSFVRENDRHECVVESLCGFAKVLQDYLISEQILTEAIYWERSEKEPDGSTYLDYGCELILKGVVTDELA